MVQPNQLNIGTTALSKNRSSNPNVFFWIVTILTFLFVIGPLVPIVAQAFLNKPIYDASASWTIDNFIRLFSDPALLKIAGNTLLFGALTMLVAQFFGALLAVIIGRTNLPGRGWMSELIVWPLFVSNLVIAFGWFIMYGPSGYITLALKSWINADLWNLYTLTGMSLVAGLSQAPLTYLMCIGAVTNADSQLEAAARSVGASPIRALVSVTIPMMRPAFLYSAVLNFVIGVEMLAIPLVFGGPVGLDTITTFLYDQGINAAVQSDYGIVGAAALILLLVVGFLVWLQGRLMKDSDRFVTVRGKASRPDIVKLEAWRWPLFIIVFAYVFFTIIAIFSGILMRASVTFLTPLIPFWELLTLDNFKLVFSQTSYIRSIWNSIIISVLGGIIGTVVVVIITFVSRRSNFKFKRSVEYIALMPRSLPGIIAGLGFFYAIIWVPGLDIIRGTIWVLIAAFVVRYIPIGFGSIAPAMTQIGEELDKAARISGASWWSTMYRIILPLLKPALFSTFALLFIHFFKEYVTAVFLYQPGSEIIGTTMLSLYAQGDNGPVSALAAVQILITALFVFIARKILGVKIYG
ncbi:Sulfate transport system permease protein CysW [Oligella ureolytica]|uniref:ABC transporter permease n=1 Tax=Oligella ureolytica TaxID=90244 RepID=UPI000E05064E|nr:iron ABC transporter permease [Oligella ureolytica]SUA59098.1 Sulfate transport system permease protein CysW [Oligella ureolytica]